MQSVLMVDVGGSHVKVLVSGAHSRVTCGRPGRHTSERSLSVP